jgi:hypothetical protein
MKILYVLRSITDKTGGGLSIVEIVKANALASKGHEVILCYTNLSNPEESTLRPVSPKVKLICLNAPEGGYTPITISYVKYLKTFHRKLQGVVNREMPDVIVATEWGSKYVVPLIKKYAGTKVVKVREYHFGSNRFKYLVRGKWRLLCHRIFHNLGYKVQSLLYDKIYLLTYRDKAENFPSNNKFDVMFNPLTLNILPPPKKTKKI